MRVLSLFYAVEYQLARVKDEMKKLEEEIEGLEKELKEGGSNA